MFTMSVLPPPITYAAQVFAADAFRVVVGANLGDHMDHPDWLCLGDTYRLTRQARTALLRFVPGPDQRPSRIAPGSDMGAPGAPVMIAARLRFMSQSGHQAEAMLMLIGPNQEDPDQICILPLHGMGTGCNYTLLGVDVSNHVLPRQDTDSLGFAQDTRVTLADGALVQVQDLRVGDLLLTRDSGAQPLRMIHHRTVPAQGADAPVVIPAGKMGNPADLVLAPHQRLFFYQQGQDRLTEAAEILVRAGRLVDMHSALRRQGGYVDYYALVLDRHEILYAEGLPCESLDASDTARPRLPCDLARGLDITLPGLRHMPHVAEDAADADLVALARALQYGT